MSALIDLTMGGLAAFSPVDDAKVSEYTGARIRDPVKQKIEDVRRPPCMKSAADPTVFNPWGTVEDVNPNDDRIDIGNGRPVTFYDSKKTPDPSDDKVIGRDTTMVYEGIVYYDVKCGDTDSAAHVYAKIDIDGEEYVLFRENGDSTFVFNGEDKTKTNNLHFDSDLSKYSSISIVYVSEKDGEDVEGRSVKAYDEGGQLIGTGTVENGESRIQESTNRKHTPEDEGCDIGGNKFYKIDIDGIEQTLYTESGDSAFKHIPNREMKPDTLYLTFDHDPPTDTGDITKENVDILVYPNPVVDEMNVVIPDGYDNVHMQIMDMNGRVLNSYNDLSSGKNYIADIGGPAGAYIVRIFTNDGEIDTCLKIINQ